MNDRAWFKDHPGRNYRLRKPGSAELNEILMGMHRDAPTAVANAGGLPDIGERGLEFRVLVIRLPRMQSVRMLCMAEQNMPDDAEIVTSIAFVIGGLLPIEKMAR